MRSLILSVVISLISYIILSNFLLPVEAKFIGVVILLILLWSLEALPLGVVSLLPIIIFPILGILDIGDVTSNYSKPIIFLFLGGFLIAIAVEKYNLHKYIATKFLKIFPKNPFGIIFSISFTSALLSSFLSNTTTTLLLLPMAISLIEKLDIQKKLVLATAYGASIGGILTPIGTPPNLILIGFLEEFGLKKISFVDWIIMMFPLVIIMLTIMSFLLSYDIKEIKLDYNKKMTLDKNQKKILVILILMIISLFINSFYLKLNDSIILLTFGLLLFLPKISLLDWEDTKKIPYQIIFLFGAGFTIAKGFVEIGLADKIAIFLLNYTNLPDILLTLLVAGIVTFSTEITSNTALTSIILPIIYKLGYYKLLIVSTICASYAFMLPIATPPNAIAMSSGVLKTKDMIKYGFILNIIGITLTTIISTIYWRI